MRLAPSFNRLTSNRLTAPSFTLKLNPNSNSILRLRMISETPKQPRKGLGGIPDPEPIPS